MSFNLRRGNKIYRGNKYSVVKTIDRDILYNICYLCYLCYLHIHTLITRAENIFLYRHMFSPSTRVTGNKPPLRIGIVVTSHNLVTHKLR